MSKPSMPDPRTRKANTSALFDRLASGYDNPAQRYFAFAADRLVDAVQPRRGEKVLDVATGTGHVATAAAQAVQGHDSDGREGRVQAIDLSESMLDQAAAKARHLGLNNIDFQCMDGEAPEYKSAYFDVVTCGFGLFFLPDMTSALGQWRRLLKPGGRVGFSSFAASAFLPQVGLFEQDLAGAGVEPAPLAAERLNTPQTCAAQLEAAGFEDIVVTPVQLGYHLRDEQEWWEIIWNTGLRTRLETLDDAQLAAFRATHLAAIAKLATADGIWLDVEVLISTGCKPA